MTGADFRDASLTGANFDGAARRLFVSRLMYAVTGDAKWQNRACGELGLVAGANGDVGSAGIALF